MKCSPRTIGVIYEVLSVNVKRPAGLLLLSDLRVAADLVYTVSVLQDWISLSIPFTHLLHQIKLGDYYSTHDFVLNKQKTQKWWL